MVYNYIQKSPFHGLFRATVILFFPRSRIAVVFLLFAVFLKFLIDERNAFQNNIGFGPSCEFATFFQQLVFGL